MTSRAVRICFCRERTRSWSEFTINFSQNKAWDLSREHQWDLTNFESVLFLSSKILNSKIPNLPLPIESWAHCLGGCIFSCSKHQRKLYILFSISFLIFWNSINFAYVSQIGNKDLVSVYIFASQREPHSLPDMVFLLTFNYFVPSEVIENRFTKINFKYFNGNCGYSSCGCWWFLFLYAPPHKGSAFWKNYLWTSLSFSYTLKITFILLRQVISLKKMVVLSVKFTILISSFSYLYSFSPFISISEIDKYLSHNIV